MEVIVYLLTKGSFENEVPVGVFSDINLLRAHMSENQIKDDGTGMVGYNQIVEFYVDDPWALTTERTFDDLEIDRFGRDAYA